MIFPKLKELALQVAPELSGSPLYIVEPPNGYSALPQVKAFTLKAIDYKIRRALIERGGWSGPGAMIVLNTGQLTDDESLTGALLHELGHNVPATAPPADHEPTADEAAKQVELIAFWAALPADTSDGAPPWQPHHGLGFIRNCLHLMHRAALLGIELPFPAVQFAGNCYGLSGAWRYAHALGDEPARMIGATFAAITETQLPTEFAELWAADVAAWHRGQAIRNQQLELT